MPLRVGRRFRAADQEAKLNVQALALLTGMVGLLSAQTAEYTGDWQTTDFDLVSVASNAKIRKVVLAQSRVTDRGIEKLKNLTNIVEFDCCYCDFITDDAVAHMRGWSKLERLNLRGTRVTSKALPYLASLPALRDLDLSNTQIEDEGFEHLQALPKLERLAIGGNRLTGACLPLLKLIPTLVELDVSGIQRVDSGLWGLPLSEENLRRLGELKQLRRLSLARATLNDRGIDRPGHPDALRKEFRDLSALRSLGNLEWLDVTGLPLTEGAASALTVKLYK
jgi:Leucine-rich repeat (LRR) protein